MQGLMSWAVLVAVLSAFAVAAAWVSARLYRASGPGGQRDMPDA